MPSQARRGQQKAGIYGKSEDLKDLGNHLEFGRTHVEESG